MTIFNKDSDIPISAAVWLTHDEYDYIDQDNYISVTSLLKPVKQSILAYRVRTNPLYKNKSYDLISFYSSRMGNAIHNSIEYAWKTHAQRGLAYLGFPDSIINNLYQITKEEETTPESIKALRDQGKIIMAQEMRMFKNLGKYLIGGKADFIFDGMVEDFKSVRVYAFNDLIRLEKERMQISIYRWLNPELIYQPIGRITQIYIDWMKSKARMSDHPSKPIISHVYDLYSFTEVEKFLKEKITMLEDLMDKPESEMPRCKAEDLWQGPSVYKYYKDASKAGKPGSRSTKNFDDAAEAHRYKATKGKDQGIILTVPGTVKACAYCAGFEMCSQKDEYINSGQLVID